MGQFLRWAGNVDVFGVEVDFITWCINWGRSAPLVVVPCHIILRLGQGGLRLFECAFHPVGELVHGLYFGWRLTQFEAHPWVSAGVQEERCVLGGGMDMVVVRELRER